MQRPLLIIVGAKILQLSEATDEFQKLRPVHIGVFIIAIVILPGDGHLAEVESLDDLCIADVKFDTWASQSESELVDGGFAPILLLNPVFASWVLKGCCNKLVAPLDAFDVDLHHFVDFHCPELGLTPALDW